MYHPRVSHEQIDAGRHFLDMDGKEVFRHAVVRMPESVRAVLTRVGRTPADVRLLVAHQANLRISEMMQRDLGLRDDQVYNNIMVYGNTTAATIPIALDECVRAGRVVPGDLVVVTAFRRNSCGVPRSAGERAPLAVPQWSFLGGRKDPER
jgi:3-oxoacyl-[acyl-carrier-protein] synthase-3